MWLDPSNSVRSVFSVVGLLQRYLQQVAWMKRSEIRGYFFPGLRCAPSRLQSLCLVRSVANNRSLRYLHFRHPCRSLIFMSLLADQAEVPAYLSAPSADKIKP